ncbi:hypothetical protein BJX70DRAFT_284028 [Aspergillus crustosus]
MMKLFHHLYHDLRVVYLVRPNLDHCWIEVGMEGLHGWRWRLRGPGAALQAGLGSFPYYRTGARIIVYAPNSDDKTQLIVLWQRMNHLIDLLAQPLSLGKLDFILLPTAQYNWTVMDQPFTSVKLLNQQLPQQQVSNLNISLERDLYDHEVVFLPLFRLTNIETLRAYHHRECSKD